MVYAYSRGVFTQHSRTARTRVREENGRHHGRLAAWRSLVDEKDGTRAFGDDNGDDERTECTECRR